MVSASENGDTASLSCLPLIVWPRRRNKDRFEAMSRWDLWQWRLCLFSAYLHLFAACSPTSSSSYSSSFTIIFCILDLNLSISTS
jgi:hypothetical protein